MSNTPPPPPPGPPQQPTPPPPQSQPKPPPPLRYQPPPHYQPQAPPPAPPTFVQPYVSPVSVMLPAGCSTVSPWGRLGAYLLEGVLLVATLWIGWLIWAAMIAGTGQTPAKRLLGHRVIGADTLRPVGFGKMFWLRGLLGGFLAGFALTFTLGVLLFMPFWDRRNQNIWDKISNTYVVSDPNDAWGTKPRGI